MMLTNCRYHVRGRLPGGCFYIGRQMGGRNPMRASPLANPYAPRSRGVNKNAVVVDDELVLEYFARHLTGQVVRGGAELLALGRLREHTTLACWCCDRRAVLVGPRRKVPETPCHGDVVFSVWSALDRLGWAVEAVDNRERTITWDVERTISPLEDLDAYNAIRRRVYEEAFGAPLRWGRRSDGEQAELLDEQGAAA